MSIPPLAGFVVAVTADRRCEEQVLLLERRGAETLVGATVRTRPLVDDDALAAAVDAVIAEPPDITVLLTGIGTRGLVAAAEGMGRDADLVAVLQESRVMARGPKAAGAAATVGLDVEWVTPGERAVEILERLRAEGVAGARIAVQRDGQAHAPLASQLAALGAVTIDIPVYRWELPHDPRPALRLIDAVLSGDVDAVTFTSSPAILHLAEIASRAGLGDALRRAFGSHVVAACVGPVCAETAADVGIAGPLVPKRARLGAMVQALAAEMSQRRRVVVTRAGEVTIQGRAAFVGDERLPLSSRERAVLDELAAAAGAVVPKTRLLRAVWGPDFDDDHAVEVAVGRLRRALGPLGGAVETVPRRGYRLAR